MNDFVSLFLNEYSDRLVSAGFDLLTQNVQTRKLNHTSVEHLTLSNHNGDVLCIETLLIENEIIRSVLYAFPENISENERTQRIIDYSEHLFSINPKNISTIAEAYFKAGVDIGLFIRDETQPFNISSPFLIKSNATYFSLDDTAKISATGIVYNPNIKSFSSLKRKKPHLNVQLSISFTTSNSFQISFIISPVFFLKNYNVFVFSDSDENPNKIISIPTNGELKFSNLRMIESTFYDEMENELNSVFKDQCVDLKTFTQEEIERAVKIAEIINY